MDATHINPRRRLTVVFISLTLALLCACSPRQSVRTTIIEVTPTPAPEIGPKPEPAPIGSERWSSLWGNVSGIWQAFHGGFPGVSSDEILGPRIYLLDIARMREDSGLSRNSTPEERQAAVELVREGSQGFAQSLWNITPEEWGWGLADVDQLLYYSGFLALEESAAVFGYASATDDPSIDPYFALLGRFDLTAIEEKLTEQGYEKHPRESTTNYYNYESNHMFSQGLSILMFGTFLGANLPAGKMDLGLQHSGIDPQLQETFAPHLEGAWGMLFAGGGRAVGWDTMAIGFWGARPTTELVFLYHYPTQEEAEKDVSLVRDALTSRTPYRDDRPPWSEMLKLEDVEVEDELLIVRATTDDPQLIGTALREHDLGFMPIRAATTVTSDLGGGWTLYEKPAKGYEIALPSTWVQLDINTETIEAFIQANGLDGTEQAKRMRSWITVGGPSFIAFGPLSEAMAEFRWMPRFDSDAQTLDEAAESWAKAIRPTSQERVTLPAGEAERFEKVIQDTDQSTGEQIEMRQIYYLLVADEGEYLLTFSSGEDQVPAYAPVFDEIARSFRVSE